MIKHLRLFPFFLSFFLLSFVEAVAGSDWNSFIVNFNKNDYGKGVKIWQIAPYDDHWTYFAGQNGVMQFDGDVWNVFPLKEAPDVRSVMVSAAQKRIYAGGINEFGYFEPTADGTLAYHCMSDTLDGAFRYLGNVWGVHEVDNIMYFQGDDRVVKYLNGKFSVIRMDAKIDCSSTVKGILYVGTDRGVWLLVGNTFFPLRGAEPLASKRIRGIIPYKEGVLVVTAYDGLYYCDGHTMTPFVTGAEAFMRENEVFCVATMGDKIALGTIHKGVLLLDCGTMRLSYFNEHNGLRNNTVLSISFDGSGNLWAGLDNGIDYICLSSSFTNLYSYPYFYGAGYAAAVEGNTLYLGTNRGLYYTSYPVEMGGDSPDIRPVPQSSGQVWNLCRVGDELFCLHDRGIFLVKDATVERVADITGVWCCQSVEGHADLMYAGVYAGVYLMEKRHGKWQTVCKIEGLNDSFRFWEQESENVLWVCERNYVTRVELNDELTKAVKSKRYYFAKDGSLMDGNVYVAKIGKQIRFTTPHGIYKYNPYKDVMESDEGMNRALNGASTSLRLFEYHDKLISLNAHEICMVSLETDGRESDVSVHSIRQSRIELVPIAEKLVPVSDSLMIIPNEEGFALFHLPAVKEQQDLSHSLYIRNMYLSYPKDSLVYTADFLGRKASPEIAYSMNSVRFEYALSFFSSGMDARFQYRLNEKDWSDFTTVQTKEYSNLPEGDYTFEVRATFPDGTTSLDAIEFRVLPPWYRSGTAYICYTLLAFLFLWLVYRWDDVRVKRQKQQVVMEKDKELHAMEQEYEEEKARQERQIVQLEKERLEYDLKQKSQEMVNLMINFTRKNEMLAEIKSEITKVSSMLKGEGAREGKQQLVLINNKIDDNMQGDEVLKRIEEQFDLIHNNFMQRLHEKHPDLSNNERMMCAYLKMNLSTKEIAPLLNLSVRGVETIRYRLRKKFGLEREDSLTDYLDNGL